MTRYKVIFSPHALDDIENACEYYNEQQRNLGKRFVKQVESTLQSIRTNPFYTSIRYYTIRCAVVSKFPFLIHYTIDEKDNIITITAVYSTYQEPLWE